MQPVRDNATRRMQAVKLIDLIDEIAPEDGVVDIFEIEASFARGTEKMVRPADPGDAVVEAAVIGESTRRMSAVEWDEAMSAVAASGSPKATMQMPAIQVAELTASITPEPSAPVAESIVEPEPEPAPLVAAPAPLVTKRNPWMLGGSIGLVAALAAVVLALTH